MKVWLDDQIDDPYIWTRHTPDGWVGVKTGQEAMELVRSGKVEAIDLDNDLGDPAGVEGIHVINLIEELAASGAIPRMEIKIHTANSMARKRMELVRERCYRFWDARDEDCA